MCPTKQYGDAAEVLLRHELPLELGAVDLHHPLDSLRMQPVGLVEVVSLTKFVLRETQVVHSVQPVGVIGRMSLRKLVQHHFLKLSRCREQALLPAGPT